MTDLQKNSHPHQDNSDGGHCSNHVDVQYGVKGSHVGEPKYGWFKFTPSFLQVIHNSRWLLGFLCAMIVVQGAAINGMVSGSLSMLEKRFGLSSTQTGLISAFYDVGVVLVLVLVTYKGGQGHKGRWIAAGCAIMGVGSLFFALPQFTTGLYEYDSKIDSKCVPGRNATSNMDCQKSNSLSNYFWWFLVAQLLHGFGASPMFTLTFVYLDENVKQSSSALYTSLLYCFSILGPAAGYLSTGQILTVYGDIGAIDMASVNLSAEDPRWYGAWWLGLVICGILALVIAIPLSGYARQLPNTASYREARTNEAQIGSDAKVLQKNFGKTVKDLPLALKNLLSNKTYVMCILSDSMEGFVMGAYASFLPKLLESVFSVSASASSTYSGAIVVTAATGGAFLSGIIMHKLNMDCGQMLRYCSICLGVALLVGSSLFLIMGCDNAQYAGVTVDYLTGNTSHSMLNLSSTCNTACDCSAEIYQPVCAGDIMYFSPCHAGCSTTQNSKIYTNCSCLANSTVQATTGKCVTSCNLMPAFMVMLFLFVFLMFMVATPQIQVILRCVPYPQRSLATGCGWVTARVLGTIPGPIVVGYIFDTACIVWGEKCGQQTSCLYYGIDSLAWKMGLVTVLVKVLSFGLGLVAWLLYKPGDPGENPDKVTAALRESVNENGVNTTPL